MRMAALTTVSTFCQRMRRGRCVVVVFKAPHFPRNWGLIQGAPAGDAPVTVDPKIWRAPRTRRVSSFWALHIGAARSVA
jgi:hypothetical protein